MLVPCVEKTKCGYATGTYSQTFSFDTLQGLPPTGAIRSVVSETALVVLRGLGVPQVMLLANGTTSGVQISKTFDEGDLTVKISAGSKISFIETIAATEPSFYTQSPASYSHELSLGADNCYTNNSTVVNGTIKLGVPMKIDDEMISRVVDTTVLKKNSDQAPAICLVRTTMNPDVCVTPSKRIYEASPTAEQLLFVIKNENPLIEITGSGVFANNVGEVIIPKQSHINLTEIPTVEVPAGFAAIVVLLKYAGILYLEILENPPGSLQGSRLPEAYNGIWVCTILYARGSTGAKSFIPTLFYGETINARAAVFAGLVGNRIYGTATGVAAVPDAQSTVAYSLPPPKLMPREDWELIIQEQNDPQSSTRRIEFVSAYREASGDTQNIPRTPLRKKKQRFE